jgi:hypothetical protein
MKKQILILYDDAFYCEKVKYVFDFIFNLPFNEFFVKIKYQEVKQFNNKICYDVIINYSSKNIESATININVTDFLKSITSYEDILNLYSKEYGFENTKLYGICNFSDTGSLNFIEDDKINLDIVSTFFFHLSRLEEYHCPLKYKDLHERMHSKEQFLVKNSIFREPVLDQISVAFLKSLDYYKQIETKKIMSHDIDVLIKFPNFYKYLRGAARILFKKKKFKGSILTFTKYYLKSLMGDHDPYQTFSWLFHKNFFDKKIVFFMSGGTTNYDNLYDIKDPSLKEVFMTAFNNGYEIGLHPSYASYKDKRQFLKEKMKLESVTGQKITSSRQHILHYDIKKTPQVLESNGISNDFTLGFQDQIGFRVGTGFEYYLWNNKEDKKFNIIETPLVIMDGCLLIESGYSVEKASKIHSDFLKTNKFDTQITYNFHNSIFDPVLLNNHKLKLFYLNL